MRDWISIELKLIHDEFIATAGEIIFVLMQMEKQTHTENLGA